MSLTKADLQQITVIVTKATAGLASKADLEQFATKADLHQELQRFATKADLDRMESRLTTSLGLVERDVLARLDHHEARIAKLEKASLVA